ncbi:uncharacterized protein [Leuresthes tenuis]|uniref:uncharacterized protein n=1 Tax=Leuresthes tenuis TaxID=355514 RepID=UPI003B5135F3
MPRKGRKAQAAKDRWRKLDVPDVPEGRAVPGTELVGHQQPSGASAHGTGWRHKVRRWPTSPFSGKSHKLVIPAQHPDKKVFVADFVPRLTVDEGYQKLIRQEFHRVAASYGLKYCHMADEFPLNRLELWAYDGVHLSDDAGMPILVQLLWRATYEALEPPAVKPLVLHRVSPPSPRMRPRIVVRGEVPAPRPPPSEWTVVGSGAKVRTWTL